VVDGIERDYPEFQIFHLDFNDATDGEAARALRVPYHPALLLIDAEGDARATILGPPDDAELRADVQALLE
jgi:hypothetical protein